MQFTGSKKNSPQGTALPMSFVLFSDTAVSVVGEDTGGRVVDVAALPAFVRHPEVLDHLCLPRIVFLEKGSIVEQGTPDEMFNRPQFARTKEFLWKITELYGKKEAE